MLVQTVSIGGHGEDMPCLGPVPAKEIHAAAREGGISMATSRRATGELSIVSARIGFGKGSLTQWEMPARTRTCLPPPTHAYSNQ